jgi:hypothetical protein
VFAALRAEIRGRRRRWRREEEIRRWRKDEVRNVHLWVYRARDSWICWIRDHLEVFGRMGWS